MNAVHAVRAYVRAAGRTAGDERGASLIEYALLLSLIAVFCIGAVVLVGDTTLASLSQTASQLP